MRRSLYDFNPYEDYFGNDAGTGNGADAGAGPGNGAAANGAAANGAAANGGAGPSAAGPGNGGGDSSLQTVVSPLAQPFAYMYKDGKMTKVPISGIQKGGMGKMTTGKGMGMMGMMGGRQKTASPITNVTPQPAAVVTTPTTISALQAGLFGDIPTWMLLAIAGAVAFFMFGQKGKKRRRYEDEY